MRPNSQSTSHKLLIGLITIFILLISIVPMAVAQEEDVSLSDPVQRALAIATETLEESLGKPVTVINWSFFQDDWSTQALWQKFGSYGIDNCAVAIPIFQKRKDLFGWTFRLTDLKREKHEIRISFDLKSAVVCDELSEEVVAPAPVKPVSGTSTENLPAPVAGSANVSGFQLGGHADGLTGDAVAKMKSAGMTWVKTQLPMNAGVGKGIEFINAAHANGFRILVGLVGEKDQLATNFDAYSAQFSQFAAEMAKAGADAIEVWNEPNLDREWPNGQINGANYVKLLASAYNAIKSANPNTLVISGAPAPTGYAGAAGCIPALCNDDVFMQQMAAAGAANYMDCVGLHYNEGIVPPSQTSADPRGEYPTYYFGSMLNRGYSLFGGKPVCFTELGYLSPEGMGAAIPASFAWAGNTTLGQHATWLAQAASAAATSGKVAIMIVWNVNFTRWDSDPMGGYALIRPDGSCPGCQTLGAVMGG